MSNFTKSIVYSGLVLVAGLVAVFSIYNNMANTDATSFANMEPAAGGYTSSMPDATEIMDDASGFVNEAVTTATEAAGATPQEISDMVDEATEEAVEEVADETEAAAEEAGEEAATEAEEAISTEAEEAAHDAASEAAEEGATEEEVQDAAEEAAEEAVEEHTDEHTEH